LSSFRILVVDWSMVACDTPDPFWSFFANAGIIFWPSLLEARPFHVTISQRSCPFWGIAPLSGGTDEYAARRR
jgi:hypothetical protein